MFSRNRTAKLPARNKKPLVDFQKDKMIAEYGGGKIPEQRKVCNETFWILRSAHAWGEAYAQAYAKSKDAKKVNFECHDNSYVEGVKLFLEENQSDWMLWLTAAFPPRVGGLSMDKSGAESTLVNVHLKYQRALRRYANAQQERSVPHKPAPPERSIVVVDLHDASSRERTSGERIPAKRRKAAATPPTPAVRIPPALDKATADSRQAFYANPMDAERTRPFIAPPTISHIDIAHTIRSNRNIAVYRAAGMGSKPVLVDPKAAAPPEVQAKWGAWARAWDKENGVISVAWGLFFGALQASNMGLGGSLIDPKSGLVKVAAQKEHRGPLNLRHLSHGTYNVVYAADDANPDLIPPGIARDRAVFRVPILKKANTDWNTVVAAARELANCLNAAEAGIGPPVLLGAAIARVERNQSRRSGDDQVLAAFDLYTCSERLDTTLMQLFNTHRLQNMGWTRTIPAQFHPDLTRVLSRTADLVFAYSVRRIIHLDASLTNFMVQSDPTYAESNGQDMYKYINKLQSITNVFAVDLDPKLFRLVEGRGGYTCLWLYNILFLSSQLKANTPPSIFGLWINQLVEPRGKTLEVLIKDVRDGVKKAAAASCSQTATDPDCHWVTQTRWRGPIATWDERTVDLVRDPEIEDLMNEMKQLVFHYFVAEQERKIERTIGPTQQQADSTKKYFQSRLVTDFRPVEEAPLMVDVLVDFLERSL